ncbi:acetylornithine deacetylase [Egicoccus sp. AB-alg6-2]|uniref:acetylornithine deacetylase n=1 Tax=Egicoccus sp. AB-alg6-2 TaxID=3242692 RepID=UPI00359EB3FB
MDTLELLDHLVGMDTTARHPNLRLLGFVEALLDEHGVPHERVVSPDGSCANLIARIGPEVEGGVVLSGHTDCVPVVGQPWTRDPFTMHRADDGRLYGRGVTDMKGFLAVVLAAVPRMVAAGLRRPVLLAFSYDEEVGTVGAPSLVERLVATQPRPEAVIIGEPTSMEVVTAHKGVRAFTTIVHGRDAHSSQPHRAANAVAAAARIATFVDDLALRHEAAGADPRFDPPYTTFNVATVVGGQAINIVPRRCELAWEYRPVPADDGNAIVDEVRRFAQDEVLPRLRRGDGSGEIEFVVEAMARALADEDGGPAETLCRELTGYTGPARTVAFGTDGGHFQAAGLSTVVCGPGSIDQAHIADEWIEGAELTAAERFVDGVIERLASD